MFRILHNLEGVEGIPLKLIIVIVIMAITIPIAFKGLESYDRFQTENNLRSELDFLSANIKQVYLNGFGNAQDVEVDFREGMMTKIEDLRIGDSVDGMWSTIRYKLNYKSAEILLIKDPNVPMGTPDVEGFGAFVIGAGIHTIHLECKVGLDFDDDGLGDLYVEVS